VIVCKVCGTENEQGAAFCGSCGAFLEWNGAVEEAGAPSGDAPTETVPLSPVPPARPAGAAANAASAEAATVSPAATGAVPAGAIVCPACGTANDPDRTFCRRCATELAPVSTAPAPVPQPRARSGPPMALLGGAAAVVLLVALGAVVLLQGRAPTDSATSAPSASSIANLSPSLPAGSPGQSGTPASPSSSGSPSAPPPSPTATPAGSPVLTGRVVFSVNTGGSHVDLWVWDAASGTQQPFVKGSGRQWDASWRWDGGAVVYLAPAGLRIADANGDPGTPSHLTRNPLDRHPAWSPDGSLIAFASPRSAATLDIYTASAEGGAQIKRLTTDPADDWDPNWSPDGSTIVFVSKRSGDAQLFLMDADGGHQRLLDLGPGVYDDPAFSPDGQWLAFTRRDSPTANKALYVARSDGSEMRRVTHAGVGEADMTWSPDSRVIAVARSTRPTERIILIDTVSDSEIGRFGVTGARNQQPDWR
jgi:hypothetical protein